MHPSVCAFRRIQLPLQGSLFVRCRPGSLPCKGRCRRRRRRGAAPCLGNTLPGRRTLPAATHPAKHGGKALPDPAGYFHRKPAMHPSVCAFRRIQLPLQGSLSGDRHPKSLPCKGRCRRRRRGGCRTWPCKCPAGPCGVFPPQSGNAPLSLRLPAHPAPLAGEPFCAAAPKSLPCKGRCRRRRRRGAAPGLVNTLPSCCALPATTPPAKHGGKPLPGRRTLPAAALIHFC